MNWISAYAITFLVSIAPLPWAAYILFRSPVQDSQRAEGWVWMMSIWGLLLMAQGHLLGAIGGYSALGIAVSSTVLLGSGLFTLTYTYSGALQPRFVWRRAIGCKAIPPFVVIILISFICAVVLRTIGRMPIGYDSYSYHLPEIGRWIYYRDFRLLPGLSKTSIGYYAYGWETVQGLFMLATRSDLFVGLPNLVIWGLGGAVVYGIARCLSASSYAASVASLVFLSLPIVLDQVAAVMVDLALAVYALASLYLILRYVKTGAWRRLELALLIACMLPGIKFSGLAYTLMLLVLGAATVVWRLTMTTQQSGVPYGRIALCIAAGGMLGGFWFARNALVTGDPMGGVASGPAAFKTTLASWALNGWIGIPELGVILQAWLEKVGVWLPFLAVAAAAGSRRLMRALAHRSVRAEVVGVLLFLAGSFLAYLVNPFSATGWGGQSLNPVWVGANVRFALPLLGTALPLLAPALPVRRYHRAWVSALWILPVLGLLVALNLRKVILQDAAQVARNSWLPVSLYLAGTGLGWGLIVLRLRTTPRLSRRGLALGIGAVSLAVLVGVTALREHRRATWHDGIQAYVDQAFAGEDTLYVATTNFPYFFYGRRMQANVVSLAFNEHVYDIPLHQQMRSTVSSLEALAGAIKQNRARYVGIGPFNGSHDVVTHAVDCGMLQLVHGSDHRREPVVYKVRRSHIGSCQASSRSRTGEASAESTVGKIP